MKKIYSIFKYFSIFFIFSISFTVKSHFQLFKKTNAFTPTITMVDKLNRTQPKTNWEILVNYDAGDFINFIGNNNVLVGAVKSESKFGVPKYEDIFLYNIKNKKKIWSAPRPKISKGEYALLTTNPFIIIIAKNSKKTIFQAYDPKNGKVKWNLKLKSPCQFCLSAFSNKLYVMSLNETSNKNRLLKAVDINTGTVCFNKIISSNHFSDNYQDFLFDKEEGLFAGGIKLCKINKTTGKIQWSKPLSEFNCKQIQIIFTSLGILVYDSTTCKLTNIKNGNTFWENKLNNPNTILISVLKSHIFRIIHKTNSTSENVVEALNEKTGEILWKFPSTNQLSSPLTLEDNKLIFTTNKVLLAVKVNNGELIFKKFLPKNFISEKTETDKFMQQPDTIYCKEEKIFLARNMVGVVAFNLENGKKLWKQDLLYSEERNLGKFGDR